MTVHSEVLYVITCDYCECSSESDVVASLDELRTLLTDNDWTFDGRRDFCPEHRDEAVSW